MDNNNVTMIYNPNNEDDNDTKEKTFEKTQSYRNSSEIDPNSTPKNDSNGQIRTNGNNNGSVGNRLDEQPLSPSQAPCLVTTVPQNMASRVLGDKHTPTRNSLRHSRMIVLNKHEKVPKKYLPYIIRHYKLVKSMKVIEIVLGTVMCLLSVGMVVWSPTLTPVDYPYWSAVPVLFSGIIGCFFLGFCPRPYPGRRLGWYYYSTKFVSILTTAVSIMACTAVFTIGIIHLVYLYTAWCVPHDTLNTTCICSVNSTATLFNESYYYEDLTCEEVDYALKPSIVILGVINIVTIVLDVLYLCAHWSSRRVYYVYAQVPLRDGIRIIDTNDS